VGLIYHTYFQKGVVVQLNMGAFGDEMEGIISVQ